MNVISPVDLSTDGSLARASVGTYYDANGVLQTAAANVPRISYDPDDLDAAPALLVEPAATNLIPHSDNFDSADWLKQYAGTANPPLVTPNVEMAPDGTMTADRIRFQSNSGATSSDQCMLVCPYFMVTAGQQYTASLYLKGPVGAQLIMRAVAGATYTILTFNGNWQRFSVTETALVANFEFGIRQAVTGVMNNDVEVAAWRAQIEAGPRATSPIYTYGGAASRAADVITPGAVIYSNVPENDYPPWSPEPAYSVGTRCVRKHRIYECLVANTNAEPENNTTGTTPKWQDRGATNQRAAFDQIIGASTTNADRITYVLRPGAFVKGLALLNLDATEVRVSVVDEGGIVRYRRTKQLRLKNSRSYSDWLFKPVVRARAVVFGDLPPYSRGLITITINKPAGTAGVGEIVLGRVYEIGKLLWEPEIRGLRYSKITTDDFGRTTFLKRRDAKEITCDLFVANSLAAEVTRVLDANTTTPVVFFADVGDNQFGDLLTALGFVGDYRTVLTSPAGSNINMKIQGFV